MTSILHFSDIHFPLRLNKMTMREMLRFKRVLAGGKLCAEATGKICRG